MRSLILAFIPVLALALLEAGWSGNPSIATMPTTMPALDAPPSDFIISARERGKRRSESSSSVRR